MKTTIQEQDGNMVAILEGSLDTSVAAETEKAMSPLNDVGGKDIIIDCTELDYIASSGLRILLGIRKKATELGSRVVLKNVGDAVRDVLDLTGFISIFEFE